MTVQEDIEPQQMFDISTDPSQEDHLAQAILQGGESPQECGLT